MHAGRFVITGLPGTELPADLAALWRRYRVGGVILFRHNVAGPEQLRRLVGDLLEVLGGDPIVSVDQEGGAVLRLPFLPSPPPGMSLGAADDPELARAVGAATARGLAAYGFNLNFAPVLDLNTNPANPVIAERSFGADPERASTLALAWHEGHVREGVATTGKHFPGHGDTTVDSHLGLPVVEKSLDELRRLELVPFARAAGRLPALMTAHIVYPELDGELPATLSRRILTGLLREELGYDGVVVSDALNMRAIADRWGAPEAAVRSLAAGADLVMPLGDLELQAQTLARIQAALDSGELDRGQLEASEGRITALARAFPARPGSYGEAQRAADRRLFVAAWTRGLTPVGDPVPPPKGACLRVVAQAQPEGDGVSEAGASGAELARLLGGYWKVDPVFVSGVDAVPGLEVATDECFNLLISNSRRPYPRTSWNWRPDLHVALWNPFAAAGVPAPALVSYGFRAEALEVVRAWLRGEAEARGRLPAPLRTTGT
ncbi:glycoside hydrolase family 3 N-terminal domain-containing protein [Oceanithermus sp.]